MALPVTLARELADHYTGTAYRDDSDDFVFGHPELGTHLDGSKWYAEQFQKALDAVGIEGACGRFTTSATPR